MTRINNDFKTSRSDDRRKKHDVAAAPKKIDIRTSVGRAGDVGRVPGFPFCSQARKAFCATYCPCFPFARRLAVPLTEITKGGPL